MSHALNGSEKIKLQANPDKFQAIKLGKSGFVNCKSLFLNGTEIKCKDSVKL